MSQPLERVRRFWQDHVNNEYFTRHERGSREYFEQIERRRYRHHYHLPPLFAEIGRRHRGERLLEIGCGIGIDTLRLARSGVGEIVAVDLTDVAVDVARERARRSSVDDVRFEVANAEELPFADGSFDAVYSFGVLHHTPDVEGAVSEVHRVLRPEGVAHVMLYHARSLVNLVHQALRLPYESPRSLDDHCPVVYRFTRDEARRLFGAFSRVDIVSEYPFTYGMRLVSRLVPRRAERWLGRRIGWHLMIEAEKAS